jgi:hypothetical protein
MGAGEAGDGRVFESEARRPARVAEDTTNNRHARFIAGRSRIRAVLTVAEVALALMLLIGAGLLVRSFIELRRVDVGFDAQRLLTASLRAPSGASADPDRITAFFQDVIQRVEQIPGVRAVAAASAVPLVSNETSPFRVDGDASSELDRNAVYAEQPKITPSYVRTMGMRLMRGREFTGTDNRTSQAVAIVSEGLAKIYWPGEDPIGTRRLGRGLRWEPIDRKWSGSSLNKQRCLGWRASRLECWVRWPCRGLCQECYSA